MRKVMPSMVDMLKKEAARHFVVEMQQCTKDTPQGGVKSSGPFIEKTGGSPILTPNPEIGGGI